MASSVTRQKILDAAVECFNRDGIANVRLQQIADEACVSVGNMTYHYRNKEAIVSAIWEQLENRLRTLMAEFRVLPLFEDIDRLLASIFALQQQYRFFYVDTLEVMRAYPDVQTGHQQHLSWQVLQMELAIQFNQSRGAFSTGLWQDQVHALAQQFWLIADHWMYRQYVHQADPDNYTAFNQLLWALFIPLMTHIGAREYEQLKSPQRGFENIAFGNL